MKVLSRQNTGEQTLVRCEGRGGRGHPTGLMAGAVTGTQRTVDAAGGHLGLPQRCGAPGGLFSFASL